ncbi:MAG TPA: DUF2786 domain-containing protein [Anaerolineae bacterium]|nr:DUF2786 domain-containing protein [Anaerolineae bacterium]
MENQTMDRESLLKKIRALMDKTVENGATVAEAAIASAKVQELLLKYDLSISEVQDRPEDDPFVTEDIFLQTEDGKHKWRKERWWLELGIAVGEAFFCETLVAAHLVSYIGRKSDVEVATYTFNVLARSLRAISKKARSEYVKQKWGTDKQPLKTMHGSEHPGVWYDSWFDGAVYEIRKKLREQSKLFTTDAKSNALIVLKAEQAEGYARNKYPRAYRASKHSILEDNSGFNGEAYRNGKRVGSSIEIAPSLYGGTQPLAKITSKGE